MNLSTVSILFACVLFCIATDMTSGQPVNAEERVRRSPLPDPQAKDQKGRGNVGVEVQRDRRVGTEVRVNAEKNIYTSRDGKTSVDAQGHWSRVYGGPARGQRDYGGGIRFSHRF